MAYWNWKKKALGDSTLKNESILKESIFFQCISKVMMGGWMGGGWLGREVGFNNFFFFGNTMYFLGHRWLKFFPWEWPYLFPSWVVFFIILYHILLHCMVYHKVLLKLILKLHGNLAWADIYRNSNLFFGQRISQVGWKGFPQVILGGHAWTSVALFFILCICKVSVTSGQIINLHIKIAWKRASIWWSHSN